MDLNLWYKNAINWIDTEAHYDQNFFLTLISQNILEKYNLGMDCQPSH